jgi:3-oxoacyl-[acyl-carrier protein] reductase
MDVTDVESVRAGIRRIQRHFGGLDAVVNNAGIASMNAAALASTESVTRMFEVNTVGTFTVSREALRALRKSASPRIVNLSSIAVPLHLEGEAAYGASKAAVEHLTRVMAREFAEWGITVNAIGPSAIATDLTSGVPRSALDALQARLSSSEPATMDDVYWTVSFLLDERSQLVTGQVMYLGGP